MIENNSGTVDGAIGSTLAEYVQSERELEWVLAFMRSTPDCAILVRPGGVIAAVNERSRELFGYEPDHLIGESIEQLVPRQFSETHPAQVASFFRDPQPVAIGLRRNLHGRHRDGHEIPVEIGLTPIEFEDVTLVLAMVRDISERVNAAERMRLLIEAAPTAMVMVNRHGTIELVNAMAEHVFGFDRNELQGEQIERLIPDRFREQHPQQVSDFFANPVPREMGVGREVLGLRKNGTEFPVELALGPLTAEGETFVLATIVDISERKRLERDLTAASEIQQTLLPRKSPQLFGFDIAGICEPANETGGDFFDYVKLGNGNLVVTVGDASGHGFGPALLAATTQTSMRTMLRAGNRMSEALNATNRLLCEEAPDANFITLTSVELTPQTGSLTFCGAGHDAYVLSNTGEVRQHLKSKDPPLALDPSIQFWLSDGVQLSPGELVLILTDGAYEVQSAEGEFYGRERIFDIVRDCQRKNAGEIVETVCEAISDFRGGGSPDDDVTLVVIKVRE